MAYSKADFFFPQANFLLKAKKKYKKEQKMERLQSRPKPMISIPSPAMFDLCGFQRIFDAESSYFSTLTNTVTRPIACTHQQLRSAKIIASFRKNFAAIFSSLVTCVCGINTHENGMFN